MKRKNSLKDSLSKLTQVEVESLKIPNVLRKLN